MDGEAAKRVASRRLGAIAVAALSAFALFATGCGGDSSREEAVEALKEAFANRVGAVPDSGATGAAAPSGGNPTIEEFGDEAGGAERAQIVTSFEAYFAALGSKGYGDACAQLAKPIKKLLERFSAAKKEQEEKGCAAIVARIPNAAETAVKVKAHGRVTEVRVKDGRAYVLFKAPGAKLYQFSLRREDGEWKPAIVSASVLQPFP
jgi:hypothetical protein